MLFVQCNRRKGLFSSLSDNYGWAIRYSQSLGGVRSVFRTSSATNDSWTETWVPAANTWYHLAFVRSGTEYKIYVDGVQLGSTRTFTNAVYVPNGVSECVIGVNQKIAGTDFAGYIDDLRIQKEKRNTSPISSRQPSRTTRFKRATPIGTT